MTHTRPIRWRPAPSIDDVRRGSDLQFEHRGRSVADVQQKLIDLGFLAREHQGRSNVDGMFGDRTRSALEEFQRRNGLDPSGRMTPETYDRLFLPGPVVSQMNQVSGLGDSAAERQRIDNRMREPELRRAAELDAYEQRAGRTAADPQQYALTERVANDATQQLEARPWTASDLGRSARFERVEFGRQRIRRLEERMLARSGGMSDVQVSAARDAMRRLEQRYAELDRTWWTSSPDASVASDMNRLERAVIRSTGG